MIVWLNGPFGAGKTTTSARVQPMLPGSRVLDPEKVGEVLMDVRPSLPDAGDFQHWAPWRPLVVETARRLLGFTGGVLVLPQTVVVEAYWRELQQGFAQHGVPVRHVLLHVEQDVLRQRILDDRVLGPSDWRLQRAATYATAYEQWLRQEAEVVDTTCLDPDGVARAVAALVGEDAARAVQDGGVTDFCIGATVRVTGVRMRGNVGTVVSVDEQRGYLVRVGAAAQDWFPVGELERFRP